jgi:hypothetical protein
MDVAGVAPADPLSLTHALLRLTEALGGALSVLGETIDRENDRRGRAIAAVGEAVTEAAALADELVLTDG